MKLQEFLRAGGTPADLQSQFAIKHRRHGVYPNLVLFKYSQLDSPMGERIVQEARGVILDESNEWEVVARSFDKFFNYGEGHAAKIDWNNGPVVQEKLDGSLCSLYYYDDAWHVATSGTPDASGEVNGFGITFAQLFWQTWDAQFGKDALKILRRNNTYAFELMTPMNRVVVKHDAPKLSLIGIRHTRMEEVHSAFFPQHITADGDLTPLLNPVRSYPLSSLDDIVRTFETMSPLSQEGYVIVGGYDEYGSLKRVKVKHPGYVALHHMKDGMSLRRVVEIVQAGEVSEVVATFPEWKVEFDNVKGKFDAMNLELATAYEEIRHLKVQKDFAIEACRTRCSSALFELRKGSVQTIREYLSKMDSRRLMATLGLKILKCACGAEAEYFGKCGSCRVAA